MRDYQRHISEAFRREQEEIAEAKNKIDIEIVYLQLQDKCVLLQTKLTESQQQVAELKEWKAARVHLYKL